MFEADDWHRTMPPNVLGRVHLHDGPMFAGKTGKLLRLQKLAAELGLATLVISHAADTRYARDYVVSHDGEKIECLAVSELGEVSIRDYHIIFIDEAQFMPDLVLFCNRAMEAGKVVHVFGLHSDYLLREFNSVRQLSLMASSVCHMTGVCSKCSERATETARISSDTERIVIGSAQYEARCKQCHTLPPTAQ